MQVPIESVVSVMVPVRCDHTTSSNRLWEAEAAGCGILLLLQSVSERPALVSQYLQTHTGMKCVPTQPHLYKFHRTHLQAQICDVK